MFYVLNKRKLIPIDPDRVYTYCPRCGAIIRATKEVHVICADCDCEFQEEI